MACCDIAVQWFDSGEILDWAYLVTSPMQCVEGLLPTRRDAQDLGRMCRGNKVKELMSTEQARPNLTLFAHGRGPDGGRSGKEQSRAEQSRENGRMKGAANDVIDVYVK